MSRRRAKLLVPLSLIESEILPRLPAKAVGRCMCVCKQWKSFLKTPMFARLHHHRVPTINDYKVLTLLDGIFFTHDGESNPIPDPPDVDFIIGSLDGLVCLAGSSRLAFWNPLTGAYKKLSPNPDPFVIGFHKGDDDAFGFYMDHDDSNDYKLVHLSVGGIFGAYIYSHRLDSWREIVFPFQQLTSHSMCTTWSEATLCGHCLYFTVSVTSTTDDHGRFIVIICFDVKTENFREIALPPLPDPDPYYSASLVILDGCIHLCVSYTLLDLRVGHLWRMYGDGWVKVQAAFSDPMCSISEYHRKHGICTASTGGNWLAVLEEESNSFKTMNTEDFTTHYGYFCSASWDYRSRRVIYVETLVSP